MPFFFFRSDPEEIGVNYLKGDSPFKNKRKQKKTNQNKQKKKGKGKRTKQIKEKNPDDLLVQTVMPENL